MGRFKPLLIFLLGFVALSNGLDDDEIRGGDDAAPGEFGYQLSLEVFGQSFCGASILGDRWALTAAHCVINPYIVTKHFPIKVVAGIQNIKKRSDPLRVEADVIRAYLPRRYLSNGKGRHVVGDIAVLKLKQSLNLESNQHLKKLELPKRSRTYANEMAKISGFGWQSVDVGVDPITGEVAETGGYASGKLRFADAKVISNKECSWKYFSVVPQTSICAQVVQRQKNDPEGVCSGDSGGPLVVDGDTVVGVVSSSPLGCAEDIKPGIYTRVSSYLDLIQGAMDGTVDSSVYVLKMPTQYP